MTAVGSSLVVGNIDDPHVTAVLGRCRRPVVVVDASTMGDELFELGLGTFVYGFDRREFSSDKHPRGWIRRLAPPDWNHGVTLDSHRAAVQSSWLAALAGIARTCGVQWLTEMDPLIVGENKLVQAVAARALGVTVPRTLVTNSAEKVRAAFNGHIIVKPLGAGQYFDEDGARAVFATRLQVDDRRLEMLAGAPFLAQELIEARTHFRVVTVGSDVWACSIEANGLDVDWRRTPSAHRSFRPCIPPVEVRAGALAVSAQLRFGYSSQDWVLDWDGRNVLLDVNPAGQWLFLPHAVADPVTESIAEWLDGGISGE